jgi:uncharacterized RDD family membrane protein YckC
VIGPARSAPRPAGYWIRLVAALVDLVLIALVQFSLSLVAGPVWGLDVGAGPVLHGMVLLFTLLFAALYTTVLHAMGGQTIGKLLVGVRVMGVDGEPLTVGAALLRWFACFVSLIPLGAGFLMAGLRRDKRALHDLIAGSRVEHVEHPALVSLAGESTPPA